MNDDRRHVGVVDVDGDKLFVIVKSRLIINVRGYEAPGSKPVGIKLSRKDESPPLRYRTKFCVLQGKVPSYR